MATRAVPAMRGLPAGAGLQGVPESNPQAGDQLVVASNGGPARARPVTSFAARDGGLSKTSPSLIQLDSCMLPARHKLDSGELATRDNAHDWIIKPPAGEVPTSGLWKTNLPFRPASSSVKPSPALSAPFSPDVISGPGSNHLSLSPFSTGLAAPAAATLPFHHHGFGSTISYVPAPFGGGVDQFDPTYPELVSHSYSFNFGAQSAEAEAAAALAAIKPPVADQESFTGHRRECDPHSSPELVSHSHRPIDASPADPMGFATFHHPQPALEYHHIEEQDQDQDADQEEEDDDDDWSTTEVVPVTAAGFSHSLRPQAVPTAARYFGVDESEISRLVYPLPDHSVSASYCQGSYCGEDDDSPASEHFYTAPPARGGGGGGGGVSSSRYDAEMAEENGEASTVASRGETPYEDDDDDRTSVDEDDDDDRTSVYEDPSDDRTSVYEDPSDDRTTVYEDSSDDEGAERQSITVAVDSSPRLSGADSAFKSDGSRKRRRFTADEREQTSKTRSRGVCLRCRVQRIRCNPNPFDSDDETCGSCLRVSTKSKKTIHHIPCRRWKLTETVWYRPGGLGLTHRWDGTRVRDVKDCADKVQHTIEVKVLCRDVHNTGYDLCNEPLKYQVRRFNPKDGDSLDRFWTKKLRSGKVEKRKVPVPPYALISIQSTTVYLHKYIDINTLSSMRKATSYSEPLVKHMFNAAIQHFGLLPSGDNKEKLFLRKLFQFWFTMRVATGSAYLDGDDKLNQDRVNDNAYPLGEKISLPRMVTAQCDGLLVEKFLRPLSKDVLRQLEQFIMQNNKSRFFTIFVATFILLHEVAYSSADRYRHARENGVTDTRYTLPNFVRELQFGANIVLLHWHYYKCILDPFAEDLRKSMLSDLSRDHLESVKRAYRLMKKRPEQPLVDGRAWEDPMHFASQMFKNNWEPIDGFPGFGW